MGKKPAIRFEGYTEDWEQVVFGDLFDIMQNVVLSRAELSNEKGVAKNIHYGDVLVKFAELLDVSKERLPFIKDANIVSKFSASLLRDGDIIIADTAEDDTVGKCCEIFNVAEEKVIAGLHTMPYRAKNKFATGYIGYCMNADSYHTQLFPLMQGTKVTSISKTAMKETYVRYPISTEEQKSISGFFSCISKLIIVHQSNYEKLVATKKSMLDKLFPQGDAKVPAIRFEGFAGDWEKKPLGAIADKSFEKNTEMLFVETFTNSAEKGIISQSDYFDHSVSKLDSLAGYFIVRVDDFVYNPRISTTAPVGPINRNKLGRCGVMSPLYTVFTVHDIEPAYLEWYFKSSYWYPYMYYNGNTGARYDRFSISDSAFFKMPILIPSIEEQKQIAGYLNSLDELIELYRIRVEKLKNIKAACLQGMFV